ncbi:MAG: hypothetical protein WDW38_011444 [Sanguina aurantia]
MEGTTLVTNTGGAAAVATFLSQATQGFVLCCLCGTSIHANPSNMCVNCIRSQVDITEGIQKSVTIFWCKECGRYLQPPKHWVRAELESKELLTFCVKKIKGLSKVKLVDAGFIWTEPHSKRLKVKMTIQAEVFNGAILQQTFVVEYVVEYNMCMDCNRHNANPNSWVACVQLRQHVFHKRTFFYLEQLILKHNADSHCIKINNIHEGVDFFFQIRGHALKFIDFLQMVVPIRYRHDKQLISHDTHSNTYNYKFTFSVEIIPLCKDDLVCLPAKCASGLGNLGPVVLVTRVTNQVSLIDPVTLRTAAMDGPVYWRSPYTAMATLKQLIEYIVLDIEPIGPAHNRMALAEATVARISDFGRNDTVFYTKTHLGNILHPGDKAFGYDVSSANLVGLDFDAFIARGGTLPEVILVRKSFDEKRKKNQAKGRGGRTWKLKRLDMDNIDETKQARNEVNEEADRERFMQELEEDPDMRSRINMYKESEVTMTASAAARAANPLAAADADNESDDGEDEDLPEVPLDELLDDLEHLNMGGSEEEEGGAEGEHAHGSDEEMGGC